MNSVANPIALAALSKALRSAKTGPTPRPKYDSRTADKFVIRGYEELFDELSGIGNYQGRSMNSEFVAAIIDGLATQKRSATMLRILKSHLGDEVSTRVLNEVPDFDLSACSTPSKCVIRLPPKVRGTIRDGVVKAITAEGGSSKSMNSWMLEALVAWITVQRQHYALLTAAMALEQPRLGLT